MASPAGFAGSNLFRAAQEIGIVGGMPRGLGNWEAQIANGGSWNGGYYSAPNNAPGMGHPLNGMMGLEYTGLAGGIRGGPEGSTTDYGQPNYTGYENGPTQGPASGNYGW